MRNLGWWRSWLCAGLLAASGGIEAGAQEQVGVAVKPIPAAEARGRIGQSVVVVEKVAEVHKTDKVIHLNLGAKFPQQTLTAVIFPAQFDAFTNVAALEGKTVEVSGKVTEYRGRPQIVLNTKGQLRVLATAPTPQK